MVFPDYSGNTVANIPGTVAKLLDVPFKGLPPLHPSLWGPIKGDISRVVVILIDALGQNIFTREEKIVEGLIRRADTLGKITSVFPSTTVAALSSLWTGFAPAQHGLVGLRLFFPEYATLGQLLGFSPNFASFPDSLIEAGTEPEEFLDVPGFAEQLSTAGVETHVFKGRQIINSALSRMHDRGVTGRHAFITAADMFVQLRQLLEKTIRGKLYVNVYWPTIDTLSHFYGPYHPAVAAEMKVIFDLFTSYILEGLSPAARRGTALFLTADHGQVVTPVHQQISLDDHPSLNDLLLMRPNGEPRTPYLFARQGKQQELMDYLQSELKQELVAWEAVEALDSGLLGPSPHSLKAFERVGDIIATMRRGHLLLTSKEMERASRFQGRHGGLTIDEMEVPWLGFRFEQ
jgi:hypothetical protein